MHAGNDHNPIAFHLEEKAVRKRPHSYATDFRMHNCNSKGVSRDELHGGAHGQSKSHAQVGMNAFVPASASLRSASASGSQTTGSVTAS